jgi:hypothetical protein
MRASLWFAHALLWKLLTAAKAPIICTAKITGTKLRGARIHTEPKALQAASRIAILI